MYSMNEMERTKNVVTVRLIFELLTCKSSARVLSAGRYIVVDIGENTAPNDAVKTMIFFCNGVKTEYGTPVSGCCSLAGSATASVCAAAPPPTSPHARP